MNDDITEEVKALLAEFAQDEGAPGLTAREWASKLSISVKAAQSLLARAKAKGVLVTGRGKREAIDGRMSQVTVYSIKRPETGRSWVKP